VLDTLVYLGQMKRMPKEDARGRAEELLDRLGMAPHRAKKVQELSHGMAQLIQFAATILHQPKLVVLDEPFNGLDPVNARLMKEVILEMRARGTALVLSSHQMNTVEELCDEVVMIDRGTVVLSGDLAEVRQRFRGDALRIVCSPWPDTLHGVTDVRREGRGYVMRLLPDATPDGVLKQLMGQGCSVEHFEVATPSMEEIFVSVVRGSHE
jgi:ABC-2 type transport system ATP-binding protein